MSVPGPVADLSRSSDVTTDAQGRTALRGSQCSQCGTSAFPLRAQCYRCGGRSTREVPLNSRGRVYSWTTVRVSATRPAPFSVAYVDLPDVRVFGPLDDPSDHRIGDEVEVVVTEHPEAPGGVGWAFRRTVRR